MAQNQGTDLDVEELLALAKLDLEKGEIEKALRKLKEAVANKKPPMETYSILARTYAQLGLFQRAQENFKIYLKANPDATVESFQLGMSHYDAGESEQALTIWDQILKKEPIHPPALYYRGLALAQLGKLADAKQALDTLLKSAAADNLYFGRARELLQAIDSGQIQPKNNDDKQGPVTKVMPKDAYALEH